MPQQPAWVRAKITLRLLHNQFIQNEANDLWYHPIPATPPLSRTYNKEAL